MPLASPARAFTKTARLFRLALATSLTLSALLFFLWSWRWPLVGDASLMHYIGFLIERGWSPYRDLGDMNMPGSYLIEMVAMRVFGNSALAWRLFDFTLLTIATASFFVIAKSPGPPFFPASSERVGFIDRRLPTLFAASLFILIHGRDGLAQGGQRDLTMAVCLLAATAFLFLAMRRSALWAAAAFGLLSGIAVTIKPTTLLLTFVQLLLACHALRPLEETSRQRNIVLNGSPPPKSFRLLLVASAAIAYLAGPVTTIVFLLREHALTAFLAACRTAIPYYASLGHRPLGYILLHSLSPVLPLVLLWLAMLALNRTSRGDAISNPHNWERTTLVAGVLFGILNCILQARALPYYRYPLLAFLLPLMAVDFTTALNFRSKTTSGAQSFPASSERAGSTTIPRILAIAALFIGGFFLAPQSAFLIHRYRWWETDFISSLEQNLTTLGGAKLSGHIQCIDTNSGCGNTLYLMRLEPSTGVLSDFFLFGSDREPAVRQTRAQFSTAIQVNPPQVILVTSRLYLADSENFQKLDRWPAFAAFLANRYTLKTQWTPARTARWWSREEFPVSYRVYVLRSNVALP